MYEKLSPKEIARIKREGRIARIRRLRQIVATGAVSLVALFSGVLLTRGFISQATANQPEGVTQKLSSNNDLTQSVSTGDDDHEGSDDSDGSDDEENASVSTTVTTPAPASAPTPAPVVTSQS